MATYTTQPDSAAGLDTFMQKNAATTNFGTDDRFYIGAINSTQIYRALIKFDLSGINPGAVVTAATLYLTQTSEGAVYDSTLAVYRSLKDWVEAQATWNIYKTSNNWTAAGGFHASDCEQTDIGTLAQSSTEANGEKAITLTASKVQEFINGVFTNNGFLLRMTLDDGTEANYHRYASSDYATAESRPKLVIEYLLGGQTILWSNE